MDKADIRLDKQIEGCIRKEIGKLDGKLLWEDFKKVKVLYIDYEDEWDDNRNVITSLEGVQYCTNLERITFKTTRISNIEILGQLKKLVFLNL